MSRSCTRALAAALVVSAGLFASAPALPTVDLQGDSLPAGARARLGSGRLRHGYTVSAVAFSPDGKTLASTSHEHTVRFWEVSTGKQLRVVGEDLARANVFGGFPWYFLGHSQADWLALIQVADLGGAYVVSLVVAAANGALADLARQP